ncbi:hypothetical protein H2204_011039 [Knufia peltigerae]|uniref:Zn(2)-C6 fungal-type domain-containing protein n=1 Tax=Knufia peltigerae TaxID=1002370 RepID=A0AA38XV77_9EURO|nr:hypothetical protein H2204_011039 [Knufia peltigerae]
MPKRNDETVAPTQRRVRTGCLTCRKRRRKCDEGKPTCQNCVDKGLVCRYGLNITFIDGTTATTSSHRPARRQITSQSAKAAEINTQPTHLQDSGPSSALSNDEPVTTVLWSEPDAFPTRNSSRAPLTTDDEPLDRLNLLSAESPVLRDFAAQANTPSSLSQHRLPAPPLGTSPGSRSSQADIAELDLLTFYRYQIATQLDLGVGDPYFGVHVLTRALSEPFLYQSILALARAYGGSKSRHGHDVTDEEPDYAAQANRAALVADHEDSITISTMLTLRKFHDVPPYLWHEWMAVTFGNINSLELMDQCVDEQWQLIARLTLAASLTAAPSSSSSSSASHRIDLSFILRRARPMIPDQILTHHQQLQQVLVNLARAASIIPRPDTGAPRQSAGRLRLPLISSWQSCWSDNQLWYTARREEMQQIFEIGEFDARLSTDDATSQMPFPTIAFSNLCALVANLAHHLTALLLLQFKPRAIRALPEPGSSISSMWHAQRIIGMVATLHESDVFDPLVVAGVLYAARRLSHPSQIMVVVNILNKVVERTGMQLQEEVEKLETAQANSFG